VPKPDDTADALAVAITHAAKQLFPPGLGVDFAFVSKNISVTDFHLVDTPDLSDHLGLSLTIDV
jgi:endonuclease/exonuclease/phosphatase family metal-dependent hydrolase